jgi:hypothetical protein
VARISVALLVSIILGVSTFVAGAAADNGATVFHRGDSACGIAGAGGSYDGFSTSVFKSDGSIIVQCVAKLTSGSPVTQALVIRDGSTLFVFSPGGTAIASYRL